MIASTKIRTFASLAGKLYVGGRFTSIGGVAANNVAVWDGSSWATMGQGLLGADNEVRDLAVYEGEIVASGSFIAADLKPTNGLARWDGATWIPMSGGGAEDLQVHGGLLFGLKSIGIVRRVGDAWVVEVPRNVSTVTIHAFTVVDDTIRATATLGSFDEAQFDVISWTGATWVRMSPVAGAGLTGPMRAFGVHRDTLVVANEVGCSKWDGASWHAFPGPVPFRVYAWIVYQGDLIAGGRFEKIGDVVCNGIARWDGTAWSPLGGGFYQEWYGEVAPGEVYDLEIYNGDLIAAGSFGERSAASLCPPGGVGRWDGTSWHAMGNGFATNNNGVHALTVHDGKLIATGRINSNEGFVSSWDGTVWEPLGEETYYAVDLISYGQSLVASVLRFNGGYFPMARWDGTFWRLIQSPSGAAGALTPYDGKLASGDFIWDGSSWAQLGQGVDGSIRALIEYHGSLYVGGNFTHAGGKPSLYIARWDGGSTPVSIEGFEAIPQESTIRLAWAVPASARGEIARIRIQRAVAPEGPFVTLAALTGVQPRTSWDDPAPPATGSVWYRLEIELANGETQVGPHVGVVRPGAILRTQIDPVPFGSGDGPIPIRYTVGADAALLRLCIHDVRGRLVRELLRGSALPGAYVRFWDRRSETGTPVARGIYWVRLSAGQSVSTRKLTVLKE